MTAAVRVFHHSSSSGVQNVHVGLFIRIFSSDSNSVFPQEGPEVGVEKLPL